MVDSYRFAFLCLTYQRLKLLQLRLHWFSPMVLRDDILATTSKMSLASSLVQVKPF